MQGIILGVLFLVPIYYRARAKGLNPAFWGGLAAVLGMGAFGAALVVPSPVSVLACYLLPGLVLLTVVLVPERSGAPGAAYLKISFACPECGKTVSFPRHREGAGVLCPECGELVTVPMDQYSPAATPALPRKRPKESGTVMFESFGHAMPAQQLAAILAGNGVRAFVAGDDAGGVLPYLGNTQGYRVMINAEDWDRAVALEQERQPEAGELHSPTQSPTA